MRPLRITAAAALTAGAVLAALPAHADPPASAPPSASTLSTSSTSGASSSEIVVSPTGDPAAAGTAAAPTTLTAAIDRAGPGTTIRLSPGIYHGPIRTVRAGTQTEPITITGPETGFDPAQRRQAVLYGTGRIVAIDHSWIHLRGFTIDGQERLAAAQVAMPTDLAGADAWKAEHQNLIDDSRLVYIGADEASRDITGILIADMLLTGAGGECVRLRNNAHANVITDTLIRNCGLYGKDAPAGTDRSRWHNGEGVYLGTSTRSTTQPLPGNDRTSGNWVWHNVIQTYGSEAVEAKEQATGNIVGYNYLGANTEAGAKGAILAFRSSGNWAIGNTLVGSLGTSIRTAADPGYTATDNTITANTTTDIATTDVP